MPELPSVVIHIREGLSSLLKDIQFWLDNLRSSSPRLYFVEDDELLDLLSIGKDFNAIVKYLPK